MARLSLLAPLGALIFTLSWLVLGFISPGYRLFDLVIAPYSPIAQPISGLGLGVTGPLMNGAFIVSGLLVLVGVLAARPLWPNTGRAPTAATVALAITGFGMLLDGLFTLESVMLHLLGFLLAIGGAVVGFSIAAVSLRSSWRIGSIMLGLAAAAAVVLFVVFMVIFDPYSAGDNSGVAGLVQRVLVTVVLGGIAFLVLGLRARRGDVARG